MLGSIDIEPRSSRGRAGPLPRSSTSREERYLKVRASGCIGRSSMDVDLFSNFPILKFSASFSAREAQLLLRDYPNSVNIMISSAEFSRGFRQDDHCPAPEIANEAQVPDWRSVCGISRNWSGTASKDLLPLIFRLRSPFSYRCYYACV